MTAVIPDVPDLEQIASNPRRGSILSGAISLSGAQVARRAFRSFFLLLSARVLGPESFGFYVLLFTVNEILAVISGGGFSDYITREVSKSPMLARQFLSRTIQLHFMYLAGIISVALLIFRFLEYPVSSLVSAALLSLTLFPRGIVESSQGIMRSMYHFHLVFWTELAQGVTLLGVGALLLFLGRGVRGIIWAELAAVLVGASVALPVSLGLSRGKTGPFFGWSRLIRETFVFNVYPLISTTYDRVDVIILAKLVGNFAVGTYGLAYKGYAALSILPYGIMGTLLPSLSNSSWNQEERESCRITLQRLYAAAFFVILVATFIADSVVRKVLGSSYQPTAVSIKILIWATIPMFLNYALNTFLLARRRERVFLWTSLICTVVNVVANLLLVRRYSYLAAAGVTVLTEVVLLGLNLTFVWKSIGYLLLPKALVKDSVFFLALFFCAREAVRFYSSTGVVVIAIAILGFYLTTMSIIPWRRGRAVYAS